jgi:hypothetical protein
MTVSFGCHGYREATVLCIDFFGRRNGKAFWSLERQLTESTFDTSITKRMADLRGRNVYCLYHFGERDSALSIFIFFLGMANKWGWHASGPTPSVSILEFYFRIPNEGNDISPRSTGEAGIRLVRTLPLGAETKGFLGKLDM